MVRADPELLDAVLELAFSLWTELGVRGPRRRHTQIAIDLERLVLFTARLERADPRLYAESLDWCSRHAAWLSAARLRALAQDLIEPAAWNRYAVWVNAHANVSWPMTTPARPARVHPSGKSRAPDLTRAALVRLRAAAAFGPGARAGVICELLARPSSEHAASSLVASGVTKRQAVNVLENLAEAGIVSRRREGNRDMYRLERIAALRDLLAPLPERFAAWDAVFPVLYASVDLAEAKSASAISAGILARKTRDRLAPALASLRLQQPASEPAALWDATIGWLAATVRAWSRGDMPDVAQ